MMTPAAAAATTLQLKFHCQLLKQQSLVHSILSLLWLLHPISLAPSPPVPNPLPLTLPVMLSMLLAKSFLKLIFLRCTIMTCVRKRPTATYLILSLSMNGCPSKQKVMESQKTATLLLMLTLVCGDLFILMVWECSVFCVWSTCKGKLDSVSFVKNHESVYS